MLKLYKILLTTAMVFPMAAFSATVTPLKTNGNVIIFDADRDSLDVISNYTMSWVKDSDIIPQAELISKNGKQWVKISYTGTKGKGNSLVEIKKEALPSLREKDRIYSGISLTIDYDGPDFEKLPVRAQFRDNTEVIVELSLEKGVRKYTVTGGFRRAAFPPDWDKLQSIWLSSDKPALTFSLQKIAMLEKAGSSAKKLKIISARKVQEILPLRRPLFAGGEIDEKVFENTLELSDFYGHESKQTLKDSPFRAHIGYDSNCLAIKTEAEFPLPPRAEVRKHDDTVFQDEAVEYFFSPWNDNDKKIQFDVNAAGTTFDYIRDYDATAVGIINIIERDLPHNKIMAYTGGIWKTIIAFPLKELQIDLNQNRFVGFQLVQNYQAKKYDSAKYKTLCWAPATRFPDARDFGVLVFNKKPFGSGDIRIKEIERYFKTENSVDLMVAFTAGDFNEGDYRLKTTAVAADYTVYNQENTITLTKAQKEHSITISSVKNLNGTYSLYLGVYNTNGDLKIAGVNFNNDTPLQDKFGDKILWPKPKEVAWGEGAFYAGKHDAIYLAEDVGKRTEKTAAIFAKDLYGYTGSKYSVIKTRDAVTSSIELKIAEEVNHNGKKVKLRKEGYYLEVMPDKVVITGADEPGLYYGCVTFIQLLKIPMEIKDGAPAQSVRIIDWPDLYNRVGKHEHQTFYIDPTLRFIENRGVGFLKEWTDRFIVGNKLNRFIIDMGSVKFNKRRPEFSGSNKLYSLENMADLAEFCRDRFVEVIPALEVPGHAAWWLLGYHPELREKGYSGQSDVTHPDHNKIVRDCMLDVIEATSAKYIFLKNDEWWHKRHPDETPDEKLRGKTRAQAFLDFHVEMNNFFKQHGVRMMTHEDMLNPYHNGKKYDVYKVIDAYPKDIIINQWGYLPDLTARYFLDRGFEVWGTGTSYFTYKDDEVKKRVNGYGAAVFGLGVAQDIKRATCPPITALPPLFMGADYAWNIHVNKGESLIDALSSGELVAVMETCAVRPNPLAAAEVVPLKMKDADTSLNRFLLEAFPGEYQPEQTPADISAGQLDIGNIPMLISGATNNCFRLGKDRTLSIPVDQKFSSLIFLHSMFVGENQMENFESLRNPYNNCPYGFPAGDYYVHYEDGEVVKLPLRLGWNLYWLNAFPTERATPDNRYIYPLTDVNGNKKFLYQWEWVNPHPEKRITRVSYAHDGYFDFDVLLFAISGRKIRGN